jgi:biotin operon repressor
MPKKKRTKSKTRILKRLPTSRDRTEKPRLWHDGSLLRRLYKEEGKSQGEIAKQLGCSLVTINKAFKTAGIQVSRGRRSMAVLAAGSRNNAKVQKAVASLPATTYRVVSPRRSTARNKIIDQLAVLDTLGPHAQKALKQDLHKLVDRL